MLYRRKPHGLEFLLVHPGGPFWSKKDGGAWSVPKGEYGGDEEALSAACREFEEEIGMRPRGELLALGPVTQRSGKTVVAWGVEGDFDPRALRSNTFTMEWPPRSGHMREFPEVDRADWFTYDEASRRINSAQLPLLAELVEKLGG